MNLFISEKELTEISSFVCLFVCLPAFMRSEEKRPTEWFHHFRYFKNGLPATRGFFSWHYDVPMIGLRPLYWGNNKQTGDLPAILNAFHAVFPFLMIFSALGPMCLAIFSYICIMLATSLYETAAAQTDHSYLINNVYTRIGLTILSGKELKWKKQKGTI